MIKLVASMKFANDSSAHLCLLRGTTHPFADVRRRTGNSRKSAENCAFLAAIIRIRSHAVGWIAGPARGPSEKSELKGPQVARHELVPSQHGWATLIGFKSFGPSADQDGLPTTAPFLRAPSNALRDDKQHELDLDPCVQVNVRWHPDSTCPTR